MPLRVARPDDLPALVQMRCHLWPDGSAAEHEAEARAYIDNTVATLPVATFLAEDDTGVIGFIDVSMRSHADGCDTRQSVGFVEGWFVEPRARGRGVGGELMATAEAWAGEHGAIEMASDTWIDEAPSIAAHQALGFEIVDRCVHFKKSIAQRQEKSSDSL